eukprot:4184889-Lingulodinium_polyedra.AAC.1
MPKGLRFSAETRAVMLGGPGVGGATAPQDELALRDVEWMLGRAAPPFWARAARAYQSVAEDAARR